MVVEAGHGAGDEAGRGAALKVYARRPYRRVKGVVVQDVVAVANPLHVEVIHNLPGRNGAGDRARAGIGCLDGMGPDGTGTVHRTGCDEDGKTCA